MAETIKTTILRPDPVGTIEGMRDTGYEFNTALADIVDNSVDADATEINITIEMDQGGVFISVADNGYGMDEDTLIRGMQYGGKGADNPKRLGKFGLGLKTASTAFCRKLKVITKDGKESRLLKATWDLDHVASVGEWELLLGGTSKFEKDTLEETASGSSGTLVIWDEIDRVLKDYDDPTGSYARTSLKKKVDKFRHHAAMTFQRYLDPEDKRARNIRMTLNREDIIHWDPFCLKEMGGENGTELVAEKELTIIQDSQKMSASLKAYVLPIRSDFSSVQAEENAKISTETQGIYIYRENRLIYNGGWMNMFVREPHLSLCRIEFSFDHRLDNALRVDIKKSQILLEEELYDHIKKKFLPAPRKAANERRRMNQKAEIFEEAKTAHDRSNRVISRQENDLHISKIDVIDEDSGEVEITNRSGKVRLNLEILDSTKKDEIVVKPVENLEDGVLWKPAIIDGHHAVLLNTGHDFYHKVYVPNLAEGVIVQGIDSLLWALVEAELGTINDATKEHFDNLRIEVSRGLRKLVKDLPDPSDSAESEE